MEFFRICWHTFRGFSTNHDRTDPLRCTLLLFIKSTINGHHHHPGYSSACTYNLFLKRGLFLSKFADWCNNEREGPRLENTDLSKQTKNRGIGTKRTRCKAQQSSRWIFSKYGLGLEGDGIVDKDDIN